MSTTLLPNKSQTLYLPPGHVISVLAEKTASVKRYSQEGELIDGVAISGNHVIGPYLTHCRVNITAMSGEVSLSGAIPDSRGLESIVSQKLSGEKRLKNRGTPLWEGKPTEAMFTITGESAVEVVVTQTDDGGLRVTTETADKYIDLVLALPYSMVVRSAALDCKAPSNLTSVSIYFGDSDLNPNINKTMTVSGGSVSTHRTGLRQLLWYSNTISAAWANTSSLDLDTDLFTHVRIRANPASGQTADFTLYGFSVNPAGRSRIAVMSDDGYSGWFKYAVPILAKRGIPSSIGVIPHLVGSSSTYADLKMLKQFVNAGNECIAHGPATGSTLYSTYTTDTQRMSDINTSREWLINQQLIDDQQAKCYVFPGGVFQTANGDAGLLDAMYASGFTLGRTTTRHMGFSGDELLVNPANSKYAALTLPIIGYIRPTTNEAADTTELSNLTSSITTCAANGLDGIIMLHDVIAAQETWASTASTDVTVDKLVTIADALVTARSDYGAEIVLFSSFAP